MKTITIARINTGIITPDEMEFPDLEAIVNGKNVNGYWMPLRKAKTTFEKINLQSFAHKLSWRHWNQEKKRWVTASNPQNKLNEFYKDGCQCYAYLFTFEMPLYIWKQKTKLAMIDGYDDVHEWVNNEITEYAWTHLQTKIFNSYEQDCKNS